jgi:hypothetical protein
MAVVICSIIFFVAAIPMPVELRFGKQALLPPFMFRTPTFLQ